MKWPAVAVLVGALLVAQATTSVGCDPDWEWCGYDWYDPYAYDPYAYDVPTYEEPSRSTWSTQWGEPTYEATVTYQPSLYEPVSVYQPAYDPAPISDPTPVYAPAYEPVIVYEPAPAYVPPAAIAEPSSSIWMPEPAPQQVPPPVAWSIPTADVMDASIAPVVAAAPAPAPAPDPIVRAAELGLHMVTSVWAGDTVLTSGLVTTYASTTIAMNAGTAARIVARLGTGEASGYDGLLFNGRMTLSDGRPVKGDVYANYVWNGYDWVFDKYVFFQDDLEIARLSSPPPTVAPPVPSPIPVTSLPLASPAPTSLPIASPPPSASAAPASVSPLTGDLPSTPDSAAAPPSVPGAPGPSRAHELRAGIALAPQGEPLGMVEVLRGRRVLLWVRATLDGAPARVVSWQLVSGELTVLGPTTGTGDEPLLATWPSVSGPRSVFAILMRAGVDVPAEGLREVDASIEVMVRSPALVE